MYLHLRRQEPGSRDRPQFPTRTRSSEGVRLCTGGRREPRLRTKLDRQVPAGPGPSGPRCGRDRKQDPSWSVPQVCIPAGLLPRVRPTQGTREDPRLIQGILMFSLSAWLNPALSGRNDAKSTTVQPSRTQSAVGRPGGDLPAVHPSTSGGLYFGKSCPDLCQQIRNENQYGLWLT